MNVKTGLTVRDEHSKKGCRLRYLGLERGTGSCRKLYNKQLTRTKPDERNSISVTGKVEQNI